MEVVNNTWPGWKCVGLIGAGSFGKVYEIQREEFGKTYKAALKVITIPQNQSELARVQSEGMGEEGVTAYFQSIVENIAKEFAIMSDLKGHSNIVSYEDHMVVPHKDEVGWDILVRMELLTPLLKWKHPTGVEGEEIIKVGIDICRALELCAKKNIIHRDIKPENIFVNDYGDFKLGDFGIARTVERTTSAMSKKGTYSYMAPEVYLCKDYGVTADIYSLGLVLYYYLNEKRMPFLPAGNITHTDLENAFERRMSGEKIPMPRNGTPGQKAAVLKALEFDPQNRFQSAEEFRLALQRGKVNAEDLTEDKTVGVFGSTSEETPKRQKEPEKSPQKESFPKSSQKDLKQKPVTDAGGDEVKGIKQFSSSANLIKIIIPVVIAAIIIVAVVAVVHHRHAGDGGSSASSGIFDNNQYTSGRVVVDIPDGFEEVNSSDNSETYKDGDNQIVLNVKESDNRESLEDLMDQMTEDKLLDNYKAMVSEINDDLDVNMVSYSEKEISDCPARITEVKVTYDDNQMIEIYQMIILTDKVYTWTFYDFDGENGKAFKQCIKEAYIEEN